MTKAPGFADYPEHKIILDTGPDPVTVTADGAIVAATTSAIILREDGYAARAYVPVGDVVAKLSPSEKTTHCPFKGDSTYYNVTVDGQRFEDAAWSYDQPFDEMSALAGHVSFDDRFDTTIG